MKKPIKIIIVQSAFSPLYPNYLKSDMYNQIIIYIENCLSPYLLGFGKGDSTEQCVNMMIERWKRALDQNKYGGAVLTDSSKVFDCLNHQHMDSGNEPLISHIIMFTIEIK